MKKLLALLMAALMAAAAAAQTVWSGSEALGWERNILVQASKFTDAAAGESLTFTVEKSQNDYQNVKIYAPTGAGWKEFSGGTYENAAYSGAIAPKFSGAKCEFSYRLTKENADALRRYGLVIHGHGVRLTKISLNGGSSGNSAGSTTANSNSADSEIWAGNQILEWSSNVEIKSTAFQNARAGDRISFGVEKVGNDYQNVKIYANSNFGWKELTGGSYANASHSGAIVPKFSSTKTEFAYTLTTENAGDLKKNGLVVHGHGVRLTKISLEGASNSAGSGNSTGGASTGSATANDSATATVPSTETKVTPKAVSGTPFSNHGRLHVSGAFLMDEKNRKYALYGMSTHGISFENYFYGSYLNDDAMRTLRDDWNTNCVRIVLYPRDYNGYLTGGDRTKLRQIVKNGIEAATKAGMYAIVDWHVHQYNPQETKAEAKAFLSEIAREYANYANVLYEICNEPTGSDWNSVLKPYAEEVIPEIRKYAKDAVIIVGTNTWSQDIEGPLANPLKFSNVMYTFHFYAQTHQQSYRDRVERAAKAGLPIFITEFGTCDASGNGGFNAGESQKWFDLCAKYSLSHLNWSLCNKGETASAIQSWCTKTSGWSEGELTESGKLVRKHFRELER